ncbi:MAG: asparagine synthase B [Succinimonas sp.]|nr:asparagine synthase B [Succinimonas sp.]
MCCIFSVCGPSLDLEELKKAMLKSVSRGPDDARAIKAGDGLMGFQRLSIMGLTPEGMQPFELKGSYCVCNGEIYGFAKIKKELIKLGYQFASDSDCEVLLPMYQEYGVKMFAMLDAEFACVIYDAKNNKWIAARDPIGIRPLYYGYTKAHDIVFASEPKCLTDLTEGKIFPFPPGHYYEDGKFVSYSDIARPDESLRDQELDTVCAKIRDLLIAGVEKRLVADAKVGFLLSGGLDSSLVCSIAARKSEHPIKTFAIGMREDAIDLKYAKQTAEYLKADHTEVIITRDDVINSLEHVICLLGTYDITTIRASMGMYLLCKAIHENTDLRVILTGEVSDELFGYKYTDFAPSADAFQKEAEKRVRELHMYDVLRADRCISANSLEARVPFGDLDFVHYVMSIDPEMKLNRYNKGKYLLRHAFEGLDYLPPEILWREKAAFSDAVGHSMVDHLKAYAEEQYDAQEFEGKRRKYKHAMPFTKESLLYREIFEKYYPEQSHMIADFWMPNKEWEGCNVNDPSARVLSNYGNSGK